MRKRLFTAVTMLFCLASANAADVSFSITSEEKEIRYRDIYFYYYNKDYFTAITLANAEREMGRLKDDGSDLELLLGLLLTGYGLHTEGEQLLLNVTESGGTKVQRNSAFYFLARHLYKSGQNGRAYSYLNRINPDLLKKGSTPEYGYIKFYLTMLNQGPDSAIKVLERLEDQNLWTKYAQYNFGASLIRLGRRDEGVAYLKELGSISNASHELNALRDKANTVLGFYYLDELSPQAAIESFERVRLEGKFSNKAMLGMGWAYSQLSDYEAALVPWVNLSRQGVHETTVQEGILASSFALQKVGALQQALDNYQNAITIYEFLREGIANTLHLIRSGQVTASIINGTDYSDTAISNRLIGVLRKDQGHLLGKLLQDDEFQYVFSQYRDLRYLDEKLQSWKAKTRLYSGLTFSGAGERPLNVNELSLRIDRQDHSLSELLKEYESLIQDKMIKVLDKQHLYVSNYLSQSRFAVAQILDSQSVVQ